jgi:hypothetical protein
MHAEEKDRLPGFCGKSMAMRKQKQILFQSVCCFCLYVLCGGAEVLAQVKSVPPPPLEQPKIEKKDSVEGSLPKGEENRDKPLDEGSSPKGRPDEDWVLMDHQHEHRRKQNIALLLAGGFNDIGVDVFWVYPVMHDGFLPQINNALKIESGILLGGYQPGRDTKWIMSFAGGARWDVYFTSLWNMYFGLKLLLNVSLNNTDFPWVLPQVSLGAEYVMTHLLKLRMELNYPQGLGLGVAFMF